MNIFNKIYQPLDQFDLYYMHNINHQPFFSIFLQNFFLKKNLLDFFFLNLSIYLLVLLIFIFLFTSKVLLKRLKLLSSTIWQYFYEIFFYNFILNILISQVGKRGQVYAIYITTLFFFILLSNFIGLIPYSFTITSHIILTFMLGASSVIGLTIIGFLKQKLHFLELFVPKGVPKVLLPLLVFIEVVSYIARGFSLSIRLFANLMSGHSLIHILLFFITKILKFNFFIGLIGLFLIIIIFLLEIGISFLQAYVFAVLVSIYLKDSYEVGH